MKMKKTKNNQLKNLTQIRIKGTEIVPGNPDIPINSNIPTHHADIVHLLFSVEGQTLISFFSRTPGLNVEECRVSLENGLAKKLVDLICKNFDYYPQKK